MVLKREPKWSKKVPPKSHKIDKNHEKWCPRSPSGQDPEKVSKPGVPWRGPCGAYTVNSISNSGPACGGLGSHFGSNWAPKWSQNWAKNCKKWFLEGTWKLTEKHARKSWKHGSQAYPKSHLKSIKVGSRRPLWTRTCSQGVPREAQGPFWYHFWVILGAVFDSFELFFK